jgi:ATP-dependent RNA helicase DeaD
MAAVRRAVDDEDLAPYLLLIEPMLSEFDAAELAAAAIALLRKKVSGSAPAPTVAAAPGPPPPPAWVRLYVSVGERDQITPRDLVGAITGEAGIEGSRVGKIEMRESFSLVEVQESVAQQVIRALNGTTIRGRATRVDFDRGRRTPAGAGPTRGPGRRA